MRTIALALTLPALVACGSTTPANVAVPTTAGAVPSGCVVDAATRLALDALAPNELALGAAALGLEAGDLSRLTAVINGNGTVADIAYVAGCLGVTI